MKKLDKHLLEVSGRVCAMEQLGGEQLGEDNLLPPTDDLGTDGPYGNRPSMDPIAQVRQRYGMAW